MLVVSAQEMRLVAALTVEDIFACVAYRWYEVLSMYPKQYVIRNSNGVQKLSQKRLSTSDEVIFVLFYSFFA